jgi:hypothetical protein
LRNISKVRNKPLQTKKDIQPIGREAQIVWEAAQIKRHKEGGRKAGRQEG